MVSIIGKAVIDPPLIKLITYKNALKLPSLYTE
jgi:hypothetical protein